jgi:TPR repeat protein
MKVYVVVALVGCCAPAAIAQTALHVQAVAKTDPCADADPEDLSSCGLGALGDGNYTAARRAWELAAQHGDYQGAIWLAQLYEAGKGIPKDPVEAYAWFDIAAALHGRAIDREHASPDPLLRDSNEAEIGARDGIAKKMSKTDVARAQQISRDWQKANPHV